MSQTIDESDWKHFRKLHPVALERFSQRILIDIELITSDTTKTSHQRYLDLYRLIEIRDEELARTFNDLRRSTAILHLCTIKSLGLITDQEFQHFTQETQDIITSLLANRRA
jgi:hypothetical protein